MERGIIQPAEEAPPKGVLLKPLLKKVQKMYVHFTGFLGEQFKGPVVPQLCAELKSRLNLDSNDLIVLRCSLEEMLESNQVLNKPVIKMIILKLLENKHYFAQNQIIPQWTGAPPVWTIAKMEDMQTITIKETNFVKLEVHALTGIKKPMNVI
jgi:hypothetical protein